jgi:hypothetical protein
VVNSIPKSKELREELIKQWSELTPEKHRDSLLRDLESDHEYVRNGASLRLAYYHPDALESAAIKQLAPKTPIILLTGFGLFHDKSEFPAVDVLASKPIRIPVLRSAIASAMEAA